GAGRRAAVGGEGLEGHVKGCATRGVPSLFERDDLSVTHRVVLVPTLSHDLAVPDDDGADQRVVAGLPPPARPRAAAAGRRWAAGLPPPAPGGRGRSPVGGVLSQEPGRARDTRPPG